MYSSRCIDIKYWKRTLCVNKRDVKRMEMSNLSTTFSKSIMKNKIWVFFYGTWEQEFSARRRKHTSCAHIKRKRFGHGYVEVFKEYETTRKLKKLEWEKDAFLFFCPIFASDAWNMFWENWDTHARKQCELKCKALSLKCF